MRRSSLLAAVLIAVTMLLSVACKQEKTYVHVGPNWARVHNLQPSEKSFKVSVKGKKSIALGDEMVFAVTSAREGQLWVIQVGSDDKVAVLFPNEMAPDNSIKKNEMMFIPPEGANWSITAQEPVGSSTVAFLVTGNANDLSRVFANQKAMGIDNNMIVNKGLALTSADPEWGVGRIVVDITK